MSSLAELLGGIPANVRAAEGAGTTTLTRDDNKHQVFNLSASRNVQLPTTGIKAGDKFLIENRAFFDLTINASGGSSLIVANSCNFEGVIQNGYCLLEALQDAPTTPAHWRIIHVTESTVSSPSTFTGNGSGSGTTPSIGIKICRFNNVVQIKINVVDGLQVTSGTSMDRLASNTAIPTRFRTTGAIGWHIHTREGSTRNIHGLITLKTDGKFEVFRDGVANFAGSTANCGVEVASFDRYMLQYSID